MIIQGGNVGIGTATPGQKLEVDGIVSAFRTDYPGVFQVNDKRSGGAPWNLYSGAVGLGHFSINESASFNVSRLAIMAGGDVGIGTTTPDEKLEVAGNLKVSGTGNGIVFPDGTVQTTAAAPTWSQTIPGPERFELVMYVAGTVNDYEAVLDRETGLVWQRETGNITYSWNEALEYCYNANIGGRKGWRLPTAEELATLVDLTESDPALPTGHPFINPVSSLYWSSTTYAYSANYAWRVGFHYGVVYYYDKTSSYYVRAVRSGQ